MSPRRADPAVRAALVDAAAELLSRGESLSTRRLTALVGTSPMAVYTHFGGMDELRSEVRIGGFVRLATELAGSPRSRDPVVDIYVLGRTYLVFAMANPHLYRVMFLDQIVGAEAGDEAVAHLVDAVQRGVAGGRFVEGEPWPMALHLWSLLHGVLSIAFTRVVAPNDVLAPLPMLAQQLFVGFGDLPDRARRSIRNAVRRIERDPALAFPPIPDLTPVASIDREAEGAG